MIGGDCEDAYASPRWRIDLSPDRLSNSPLLSLEATPSPRPLAVVSSSMAAEDPKGTMPENPDSLDRLDLPLVNRPYFRGTTDDCSDDVTETASE